MRTNVYGEIEKYFFIPDSNKISLDLSHFSEIKMILVFAIHERVP